jgi:hypothetical protein
LGFDAAMPCWIVLTIGDALNLICQADLKLSGGWSNEDSMAKVAEKRNAKSASHSVFREIVY